MVPEKRATFLTTMLNDSSIDWTITIPDVQRLIIEREAPKHSSWMSYLGSNTVFEALFKRIRKNTGAYYRFGDYHEYQEIIDYVDAIAREYPEIAKTFIAGHSTEGRVLKGLKIGSPISDTNKRAVWIDGGMHAREWASVHTALYFIKQLIENYERQPQVKAFIDELNIYILPLVNPDGYEYSRSEITPKARLWRKNRGNVRCQVSRWWGSICCGGTDLNRNFDYHWSESGSSPSTCSEVYQGAAPFSEPETRAVRDMLLSAELSGKTDAFITLHTYAQMWMHPFGTHTSDYPADVAELRDVARNSVSALSGVYGTRFKYGTGADLMYPSSGGSDDWAKGKAGVKYVYLLELRPSDSSWDGFLLDPRLLIPVGVETWEGVKVVIQRVLDNKRRQYGGGETLQSVTEAYTTQVPCHTALVGNHDHAEAVVGGDHYATALVVTAGVSDDDTEDRTVVGDNHDGAMDLYKTVVGNNDNDNHSESDDDNKVMVGHHAETLVGDHDDGPALKLPKSLGWNYRDVNKKCEDLVPWCKGWLAGNSNMCSSPSFFVATKCSRTSGANHFHSLTCTSSGRPPLGTMRGRVLLAAAVLLLAGVQGSTLKVTLKLIPNDKEVPSFKCWIEVGDPLKEYSTQKYDYDATPKDGSTLQPWTSEFFKDNINTEDMREDFVGGSKTVPIVVKIQYANEDTETSEPYVFDGQTISKDFKPRIGKVVINVRQLCDSATKGFLCLEECNCMDCSSAVCDPIDHGFGDKPTEIGVTSDWSTGEYFTAAAVGVIVILTFMGGLAYGFYAMRRKPAFDETYDGYDADEFDVEAAVGTKEDEDDDEADDEGKEGKDGVSRDRHSRSKHSKTAKSFSSRERASKERKIKKNKKKNPSTMKTKTKKRDDKRKKDRTLTRTQITTEASNEKKGSSGEATTAKRVPSQETQTAMGRVPSREAQTANNTTTSAEQATQDPGHASNEKK
ncbi:unnamed protein product, partial [Mesorhabditis spiculigera]